MLNLIKTCPRCTGTILSDLTPGRHPGAMSRTDDATEICSRCGSDEAIRLHIEGEIVGQRDWPMVDAHQYGHAS